MIALLFSIKKWTEKSNVVKWNKIYPKHLKVFVRGNVNVGHTFESPPSFKIIWHLRLEIMPVGCFIHGVKGRSKRMHSLRSAWTGGKDWDLKVL